MADVLTALVVRLKRRAIRANTNGEVGLASDLLKAVALIGESPCLQGRLVGSPLRPVAAPAKRRTLMKRSIERGLDIRPQIFCRRPSAPPAVRRRCTCSETHNCVTFSQNKLIALGCRRCVAAKQLIVIFVGHLCGMLLT